MRLFGCESELWVAGHVIGPTYRDGIIVSAWDIIGVFSSEKLAVAACTNINDFVGPIPVNMTLCSEAVYWPRSYYPLEERNG